MAPRALYWLISDTDIQRMENDSNGMVIYIGKAAPGSSESDAKWQIRKLTYVNNVVTQVDFADGSPAYAKVWADRPSYSYF